MIMGEDNLKSLQMEKLWVLLQNHKSMFIQGIKWTRDSDLKTTKVHLIDAHSWNFFYFYSKKH
jgi:hypothetical protein